MYTYINLYIKLIETNVAKKNRIYCNNRNIITLISNRRNKDNDHRIIFMRISLIFINKRITCIKFTTLRRRLAFSFNPY